MRKGISIAKPAAAALAVALALLVPVPAGADGGPGRLGASGDAGTSGVAPLAIFQPAGALPGIDVSHHQGLIDWAQVAGSGQRFAIAKVTEGRTFIDPNYAFNKAQAEANGVAFGAYHFARPDDGANDAIVEADHFVDQAELVPGNVIPVLDLERTGGLTQAQVTQWILDWLARVTERVGARPMVYTSPNGWDTRTGDTTAVADAGYTTLWVAHWGVSEPRVPAENWAGHGWTFWQYSDCGSVPGIGGCVDTDWYRTSDLEPVLIPSPDVTPPRATLTAPTDLDEPVTVRFNEPVRQVTPQNTYLWTPSTGTYPPSALECGSKTGAAVDCVTGRVRSVLIRPAEPLVPGESYEAIVNPQVAPVLVVDRGGNPAPTTTLPIATPTSLEQDSVAARYAWAEVRSRRAVGGSYEVERVRGAAVAFGFRGPRIRWVTAEGPAMGVAIVSIDGDAQGSFDLYAARTRFEVERTFDGLGRGEHTIEIRALGRADRDATDTRVVVDAFRTAGGTTADPDLDARWASVRDASASGGDLVTSDLAGVQAELTFRGTGIEWVTMRGPDQGRAEIYVDGVLVRTVDNFAAATEFGVVRSVTGLAEGVHTLRIFVLGTARPASDGTAVAIDRFVVVGV